MSFNEPRTDGLLRGPRSERKELLVGLADAPWDLETLLGLHLYLSSSTASWTSYERVLTAITFFDGTSGRIT